VAQKVIKEAYEVIEDQERMIEEEFTEARSSLRS
jgi:hypothetical protein